MMRLAANKILVISATALAALATLILFQSLGQTRTTSSSFQNQESHDRIRSLETGFQRDGCSQADLDKVDVCDELSRPSLTMCQSEYRVPLTTTESEYTVVILTHTRWFLLYKLLPHYTLLPNVRAVVILWYNPGFDPPQNLTDSKNMNGKEVLIHRLEQGHIDLRWQSFPEIKTQAVFSLDDDKMVALEDVERAFKVWKSHPYGLVGFENRNFFRNNTDGKLKYVLKNLRFSIILPNCAFVHREYLRMFSENLPLGMKRMIRALKNCEDLALNMMISHHCKCAPSMLLTPVSKIKNLGPKSVEFSLHARPTHYRERSDCLNVFEDFFHKMPLKAIECTYNE